MWRNRGIPTRGVGPGNRLLVLLLLPAWTALAAPPPAAGPQPPAVSTPCTGDPLVSQDFASGFGAWTLIDGGSTGAGATWTLENPGERTLPLTEPFAIVDSDAFGFGSFDDQLISPAVDTSGIGCVQLNFSHVFKWYSSGSSEQGDVNVRSSATTGQWVNLTTYTGADAGGSVAIDISAYAGEDTQVSFYYHGANWDWYWAVDDISITGDFTLIFADNFESGDTLAWSGVVGEGTRISAGEDWFWTLPDGTFDTVEVPAGFFGEGSNPLTVEVPFEHDLSPAFAQRDTVVQRLDSVILPLSLGAEVSTRIVITEVGLQSQQPITVTFDNGTGPRNFDVFARLSSVAQSEGTMTIRRGCAGGGTYEAELPVLPKLVFQEVGNPGNEFVLDTGLEGLSPIVLQASNDVWCDDRAGALPLGNDFYPTCEVCVTPGVKPISLIAFDRAQHCINLRASHVATGLVQR